MNKEEKDLCNVEKGLFNELLSVILYLNVNGMRIDTIKEMIHLKVDDAFGTYKNDMVRERWQKREDKKHE